MSGSIGKFSDLPYFLTTEYFNSVITSNETVIAGVSKTPTYFNSASSFAFPKIWNFIPDASRLL